MKKAYLVCEVGYEYNDCNYYLPESGGVVPKTVFSTREKAEKEAEKLNIKRFREINPTHYCEELSTISSHSDQEIADLIYDIPGAENMQEDGLDLKKLPEADIKKIMEAFDLLRFFEVQEVDME